MPAWDLDGIAAEFQRAALDPAAWISVLDKLSETVGGHGAVLVSTDHRVPGPPVSDSIKDMIGEYFRDGWNKHDLRFRGVPFALRNGISVDQDFVSPEEMERSPYYNDWLRRHNCRFFAGLAVVPGETFWCISIQRTIQQGSFDPDEVRRLSTLSRPMTDAIALSRQFGQAHVLGMADALQQTRQAAILLDEGGRVLAANALAEARMGTGIDVAGRDVTFSDRESQVAFDRLVAQALSPLAHEGPLATVAVVRDSNGARLFLRAIALRGWARFTFTQASVLLLLGPPEETGMAEAILRSAFALTPAEIRLALALMRGLSTAEAAEKSGIRYETARVQLRSIFQKTETRRQGELIALLMRTLAR